MKCFLNYRKSFIRYWKVVVVGDFLRLFKFLEIYGAFEVLEKHIGSDVIEFLRYSLSDKFYNRIF